MFSDMVALARKSAKPFSCNLRLKMKKRPKMDFQHLNKNQRVVGFQLYNRRFVRFDILYQVRIRNHWTAKNFPSKNLVENPQADTMLNHIV